jgi:hypothetical protein
MASTFLAPVAAVVSNVAWTTIGTPTPAGKVRRCDIRAVNVGAAASTVNVQLTDGANVVPCCQNHPVAYNDRDDAPDIEDAIELPPGWYVQGKAGAAATVSVRLTNLLETDLTDFS